MLATLSFITDKELYQTEQPFEVIGFPTSEVPQELTSNLDYTPYDSILVNDARDRENQCTIAEHGFTWIRHKSKHLTDGSLFESVTSSNADLEAFLQETVVLVRETLGASEVIAFDWRVRLYFSSPESLFLSTP